MEHWFTEIATRLLNGARLLVGSEPHRFAEIEFYYFSAAHPDPFTHRDPLQRTLGQWYFHRTRGVYRSGSFKGLDLAFGDDQAFGGILIRSLETSDGTLIDGPSRSVDHLLARTGFATVADLDRAIAGRAAWEAGNPLFLQEIQPLEERPIYRSARVGLSLKKTRTAAEQTRFLLRPYRFLTEPRRIRKGKLHLILALHRQGVSPEPIQQLTGSPRATIRRYLEDYEAGRQEKDFTPYFGQDMTPRVLCRLHGIEVATGGTRIKHG